MNIRCSCHITIFNMTNVFRFFKQKNQSQQENETKCPAAVDLQNLKVKEQDINLTKSYCITISIQKISSIDKFILKIHQIFGSHELNGYGNVCPRSPPPLPTKKKIKKIIDSTYSFPEFVPPCKKPVYSIYAFLRSVNFKFP